MRSCFVPLVILAAATAAAQPYVGNEVRFPVSEIPITISTAPSSALSIAAGDGEFAVTWSSGAAQSRVSIMRLDGALRPASAQRDLAPFFGDGYDAVDPQVVVTPSGYAVAWRERKRTEEKQPIFIIVARLTKTFETETVMNVAATPPDTRFRLGNGAGDDLVLGVDPVVYTLKRDGAILLAGGASVLDDVAATPQHLAYVAHSLTPASDCFTLFGGPVCRTPAHFDARVVLDGVASDRLTVSSPPPTPPSGFTLSTDGSKQFLTWIGTHGEIFASALAKPPQSLDDPLNLGTMTATPPYASLPVSAGDGERWLVVRQSNEDIVGSVVEANGMTHDVMIAASSEPEQRPVVIAAAKGVFVVAYEIDVDATHRQLAARYVTFLPPHHRPGAK